jgi:hypothetical protein
MSRHAAVELPFGDGRYTFRLGLDEIEELERKCDRGIFQVANRLLPQRREATLGEIMEAIRIGLIGGGMIPVEAMALVRRYVDQRPIEESRDVAYAVVMAALMRLHSKELETPPGEPKAAKRVRKTSASTSPRSTARRSP